MFSFIVGLVLSVSGTAISAPLPSSCPSTIVRVSALINEIPHDENLSVKDRIISLGKVRPDAQGLWAKSQSAADQLTLMLKVLDFLGYDDDLILSDPEKAAAYIAKAKLKDGELTPTRAFQILVKIHQLNFKDRDFSQRYLYDSLSNKEEKDRLRVETAILKTKAAPDLINALLFLGIVDKPLMGPPKRWNRFFLNSWVQYGMTFAVNAMTTYMSHLPLPSFFPRSRPSDLTHVPEKVMDIIVKKGWTDGYPEVEPLLKGWGRADQIWDVGQKAFISYMGVMMLYMAVDYAPWVKTAYTSLLKHDKQSMTKFEQRGYDSNKVVMEQYNGWLDSCDSPPTEQERAAELQKIRQMEKEGVFKIYIK